jgi:hypothetical protein
MAVQTSGSVTLEIGVLGDVKRIVLDGTVGDQIQVGFRAKDGGREVQVGTFTSIIGSVAQALGAGDNFKVEFEKKLTDLEVIAPLCRLLPSRFTLTAASRSMSALALAIASGEVCSIAAMPFSVLTVMAAASNRSVAPVAGSDAPVSEAR